MENNKAKLTLATSSRPSDPLARPVKVQVNLEVLRAWLASEPEQESSAASTNEDEEIGSLRWRRSA